MWFPLNIYTIYISKDHELYALYVFLWWCVYIYIKIYKSLFFGGGGIRESRIDFDVKHKPSLAVLLTLPFRISG